VQRGGEYGSFNRKLKAAFLQEFAQDVGDAEGFPQPAKQR
jgi:hypothetical protein